MHWSDLIADKDGTLSWRKILTAVSGVLFLAACIISWTGGKQLPTEYIMIISGVFAFYFLKNRFSGQSPWTGFHPGNQPQLPQQPQNNGNNGENGDDSNGNGSGKEDISGP